MSKREILLTHRWGQALVEKQTRGTKTRVVKDYSKCGFPGTLLYGRLLPKREFRALCTIPPRRGIPNDARLESPYIISYAFLEGITLREAEGTIPLSQTFFTELWSLMSHMHQHGFVHLDLGNRGNVLILDDGAPAIIDFASCTSTRFLPGWLRRALEKRDKLGLLKLWHRHAPDTVPPTLAHYYAKHYKKNLATPSRFYRATRHCLDSNQTHGECARVRRIWIFATLTMSIAATLGLISR